ncbi:CMP-N-acetylneuraminate-beta-galactosamide-alpha-2, 3-sialyltransferase [Moraxella osloensis]|nr:glycosyltransferase family 52 [Moraxella osloensis]MBW4015659.1 CMP-N-acetylneuraminate-beta-galactosamide-alpha-2, 3-sialyltransferase [Moraxella osloensis]
MNLIICITPLQVLIAKQIIKQHSAPFIGLYLPYGIHSKSEPKHRYYFDQLEQVCEKSAFIELNNKTWGERFATLNQIKTTLKKLGIWQQSIDGVYLASIDVLFLQYIISKVTFQQLYTFDDGTANIFPNSSYFQPLPKSLPLQLFKHAVGITYPSIPSILAISKKHFTIFPQEKNIIDATEPVYLFDKLDHQPDENLPVKRLLLGQALDNFIGETAYRDIVTKMVSEFAIDAFCPHPRENLDFSHLLPVIDSDKIIEDYLSEALQQNPQQRFEIYTFISTAVFSLKEFPRTQVFMVYTQALWDKFPDAYQFLASRGFTLINLDDADNLNGFKG